ncbi:uncharacterized protein LOC117292827, partial [Asterias rubens]|uniref:uncharacterized protein LOC117292827 n=1 Tax=Asterias rubens TaxID=7604 RepID=UPI0014555D33
WELEDSEKRLQRAGLSRLEILEKSHLDECICKGEWLACAENVLLNNDLCNKSFSKAVTTLLDEGRGKYRNIMITGPANCGKTFLLNPLNKIYNVFTNPATTTFAWVGAEQSEIIFLNDFRWTSQIIPWQDLLLLLEGQLVHLPAPKSHFAQDLILNKDTPIFCTRKNPIVLVKGGSVDERETEMMAVCWKILPFHHQIPEDEQKCVPPCTRCFASLILNKE